MVRMRKCTLTDHCNERVRGAQVPANGG
jgi:hypothetical protein